MGDCLLGRSAFNGRSGAARRKSKILDNSPRTGDGANNQNVDPRFPSHSNNSRGSPPGSGLRHFIKERGCPAGIESGQFSDFASDEGETTTLSQKYELGKPTQSRASDNMKRATRQGFFDRRKGVFTEIRGRKRIIRNDPGRAAQYQDSP